MSWDKSVLLKIIGAKEYLRNFTGSTKNCIKRIMIYVLLQSLRATTGRCGAHERVGFEIVNTFRDATDEWNILILNFKV